MYVYLLKAARVFDCTLMQFAFFLFLSVSTSGGWFWHLGVCFYLFYSFDFFFIIILGWFNSGGRMSTGFKNGWNSCWMFSLKYIVLFKELFFIKLLLIFFHKGFTLIPNPKSDVWCLILLKWHPQTVRVVILQIWNKNTYALMNLNCFVKKGGKKKLIALCLPS